VSLGIVIFFRDFPIARAPHDRRNLSKSVFTQEVRKPEDTRRSLARRFLAGKGSVFKENDRESGNYFLHDLKQARATGV